MIFEEKFKNYKSLYLCVSGGVDSALGLFLICKQLTEKNINAKVTVVTGVEPQPYYARNDKNVKKIITIVNEMFPKINITHLVTILDGYKRPDPKNPEVLKKEFPKVAKMRIMHNNNWELGDYDLGISFQSSFPKLEELKKHEKLYQGSLFVGPEDRNWTGTKNDKIRSHSRGGDWWQPFLNMTKKDFERLYVEHNLMSSLFPYTASCTGRAEITDNFTKPCKKCFWCLEKYWAFDLFDLPEAYNL